MKIKIKKLHPEAKLPIRSSSEAAGYDLSAVSMSEQQHLVRYGTGLAFEIPKGYVGLIFPRSSIYKKDLKLSNCVGVIDSDYRGEVSFVFKEDPAQMGTYEGVVYSHKRPDGKYELGDRIGQLVVIKHEELEFEEADLNETQRGTGGYGSTGK